MGEQAELSGLAKLNGREHSEAKRTEAKRAKAKQSKAKQSKAPER
jgi:hypothetical protein